MESNENSKEGITAHIKTEQVITIPLDEYKKLIKKAAKLRTYKMELSRVKNEKTDLYLQVCEQKDIVKQYKADIERLLGINELEKVKAEQEENA